MILRCNNVQTITMKLSLLLVVLITAFCGQAQTAASTFDFIEYQRSFPRISEALKRKEDTLVKQFREKNLPWPARYLYLRSFKYDSELEVWVKYGLTEKYQLFKTYKVCALAGTLGPKRMQGDYQVPEGFYYINEFNPKSMYHLSLGLNYPNLSDRILSDSIQPGGDIYIHGKCVTTGCIPINDQQIEELYILAAHARNEGQDFIPVHIFPIDFKEQKSITYLAKYLKDFPEYAPLTAEMKRAYQYFNKTKKLPLIMVNKNGGYVVEGDIPEDQEAVRKEKKKALRPQKHFSEEEIAKVVDKLPVFPGGNEAFRNFIEDLSRQMVSYLDEGQEKTFVMLEFIIDTDGQPRNAKVIRGGNDAINEIIEEKFEKMSAWTPAIRGEKSVAIRLKQSISIEKPSAKN